MESLVFAVFRQFVDPCRQLEYSPEEIGYFLDAMIEGAKHVEPLLRQVKRILTHL